MSDASIRLIRNGDPALIAFRTQGDAAQLLGPLDELLRYDRHDRVFRVLASNWPQVRAWCTTRSITVLDVEPEPGTRPQPQPFHRDDIDPRQVEINARGIALARAMLKLARNRARLQAGRHQQQEGA